MERPGTAHERSPGSANALSSIELSILKSLLVRFLASRGPCRLLTQGSGLSQGRPRGP